MATDSLPLDGLGGKEEVWTKLKVLEERYYNTLAKYCLLQEGVKDTPKQVKARVDYLSAPLSKDIFLGKPFTFRVNKALLEGCWYELIKHEDEYYQAMAHCSLLNKENERPSDEQVQNKINKLSHIYLRKSIFLKPLKKREIECLEQASFGKGSRETAIFLGISEVIVKKYRISSCNKLRCEKISEAISIATLMGYLPIKEKLPLFQLQEPEELENASV